MGGEKNLPFVSEELEKQIINEFARITGVKASDVEVNVQDRFDRLAITLKSHAQSKDETVDTDLTIERLEGERNKYNFSGRINVTGKTTQTREIAQVYTGSPQSIPFAMRKILAIAKIKKGGLLSKYFGVG
jgi:hypothetical protein